MLTLLNLVKTEPELELFQSYISHVPKVSFISLVSHPYIIKIKTIFLLFEFWKKSRPPPLLKIVYIMSSGLFPHIGTFFVLF